MKYGPCRIQLISRFILFPSFILRWRKWAARPETSPPFGPCMGRGQTTLQRRHPPSISISDHWVMFREYFSQSNSMKEATRCVEKPTEPLFSGHVGNQVILSERSQEEALCLTRDNWLYFYKREHHDDTESSRTGRYTAACPAAQTHLCPPFPWHQQIHRNALTQEGRASLGTCPHQVENPICPGSLPSTSCHIPSIMQPRLGLEAAGSMDLEPGHLKCRGSKGLGETLWHWLPPERTCNSANDPGQRRLHQKSMDELSLGNLFSVPLNWKPLTFFWVVKPVSNW